MQNQTYEDKNTKLNEVACHFSLIYGPSKFLISLHINISIRYVEETYVFNQQILLFFCTLFYSVNDERDGYVILGL